MRATDNKTLRQVPPSIFKRGWYSIGFLYAGLHPDSALEHGRELSNDFEGFPEIKRIEPRLLSPYYVQSGWPVVLAPVAEEAWRRYEADALNDEEFYCSEAVIAGICSRSTELAEEVRRERERTNTKNHV